MPTTVSEGRHGPRWTTVGAILLGILLVAPLAIHVSVAAPRAPVPPIPTASGPTASGPTASGVAGAAPMAHSRVSMAVLRPPAPAAAQNPVTTAAPPAAIPPTAAAQTQTAEAETAEVREARIRLEASTLLSLWREQDYRIEDVRSGSLAVPRVLLAAMPRDMADDLDPDARKDLFLKTMLPLVLLANEEIARDRARLQRLHALRQAGYALAAADQAWLAGLATRYGVGDTGAAGTKLLLQRVDIVPPSLTLAQAAEESGWGTSRFAQQGNALFGQLTWSSQHDGIVPRDRKPGERHRFRSFQDLLGSVQAYMHNLNTHRAYMEFRRQRAALRRAGKPVSGYLLAGHIEQYSERGSDYIAAVRGLIRSNRLGDFDSAVLHEDDQQILLRVDPPARRAQGGSASPAADQVMTVRADGAGAPAPLVLPANLPQPGEPATGTPQERF